MTELKRRILTKVHNSNLTAPVRRSDFYKKTRTINLYKQSIDELMADKLLKQRIGSDVLEITQSGVAALEAADDERRKFRKESVRYWITTGIAILALAISIIAIAAE